MAKTFGFGLIALLAAVLVYVRVAPSDPARWNVPIPEQSDADYAYGAVRILPADEAVFERADKYMRALPRTRVLAGTLAERRITYITRSAVFAFPDYTTIEYSDGVLKAYARLRFGGSDMGVNRARLQGLLAALQ